MLPIGIINLNNETYFDEIFIRNLSAHWLKLFYGLYLIYYSIRISRVIPTEKTISLSYACTLQSYIDVFGIHRKKCEKYCFDLTAKNPKAD